MYRSLNLSLRLQAMTDSEHPSPLRHLRLSHNAIGTRGAAALGEWLLAAPTRLHSLRLAATVGARPAALDAVLKAIAQRHRRPRKQSPQSQQTKGGDGSDGDRSGTVQGLALAVLDVAHNRLTDAEAPALAAAWRASHRTLVWSNRRIEQTNDRFNFEF
jgi:hypothetical protein